MRTIPVQTEELVLFGYRSTTLLVIPNGLWQKSTSTLLLWDKFRIDYVPTVRLTVLTTDREMLDIRAAVLYRRERRDLPKPKWAKGVHPKLQKVADAYPKHLRGGELVKGPYGGNMFLRSTAIGASRFLDTKTI